MMEAYLIYIVQSALCLTMLYLPFRLWLRKETFFRINRLGLLGITVLAFLLPLLSFPWLVKETYVSLPEVTIIGYASEMTEAAHPSISWSFIIMGVYILGCVYCLAHKLREWIRVNRFIRQGCLWTSHENGIHIHCHACSMPPFSWLNHIVISEKDYQESGRVILLHETAHIRCRHSWDMIGLSIIEVLQWFNPVIWMITKDMQDIHEYEADRWVLSQGENSVAYQMLLIDRGTDSSSFGLTNHFSRSLIKKRIQMINQSPSRLWSRVKLLYLIPVAVGFIWVSSPTCIAIEDRDKETSSEILKFIGRRMKYPTEAITQGIEGKVTLEMILDEKGNRIWKVKEGVAPLLDEETLRVLQEMPQWETHSDGNIHYMIPIHFIIEQPL